LAIVLKFIATTLGPVKLPSFQERIELLADGNIEKLPSPPQGKQLPQLSDLQLQL